MLSPHELQELVIYSKANLQLTSATLGKEYYYAHMPLCVIDSVFSIGVRYEGVRNTVHRFCEYHQITPYRQTSELPPVREQESTSSILQLVLEKSPEQLAGEVYRNKQRTSPRSGILKAEAVVMFLKVLLNYTADYFQDVPALFRNTSFEQEIKRIPGQGSGISLQYFFMLAGSDELIKPDRMVLRYLEAATSRRFSIPEAQQALTQLSQKLSEEGYSMTPRLLDHIIWAYQRK